ncbi:MAG: hypothetical protein Q8P46_05675 [Hyphomicrobiales bacterium]|nr:hypothetical protein [Hyphomicrobiales bacterium]
MEVREERSDAVALDGEWAAIRRTLNDYMERHGIGVAALRQQIAAGTDRSPDDLTDQALLRFLAGRERAGNDIVALCTAFAEQTGQRDPVIALGDALAGFQQCDPDDDRRAAICGAYEVTAHLAPIEGLPVKDPAVRYGAISFEAIAGRPYLRAVETTPDRSASKLREEAGQDHVFEGVALVQAHGVTAYLRDMLTRRPKSYVLDRQAAARPGKFSGIVTSPAYDGRTGAGGVVLDVTLAEIKQE